MEAMERNEMERKTFMEISTQILVDDEYYFFRNLAIDDEVRKTGEIIGYGSYSRDKLVEYTKRYGYNELNAFVKMLGDKILERKAREEAEAKKAEEAEEGAKDE